MKKKSLWLFLPLGLFIKIATNIAISSNLLNNFFNGVFNGVSLVFILAGIFYLASSLCKK